MKWKIEKGYEGLQIREYLQQVHRFSHRIIKSLKGDGGEICVNGERQSVRYTLLENDLLTIKFPPEKRGYYMEPEFLPLSVVYEDDDVIVINKPAGQVTVPSRLHPRGTVANSLLGYYEEKNIPYTVHVVTRLDKETSGLLLIAKHRYSHSLLSSSLQKGEIKRVYKAIVEGRMKNKRGTINAPIGRKEGSIIERTVTEAGQIAITEYEVEHEASNHTLVDIHLITGRTHQIRVHFSHLNHPLAGDDLYGGKRRYIERTALHCYKISFFHPITKETILLKEPIPEDMSTVLK